MKKDEMTDLIAELDEIANDYLEKERTPEKAKQAITNDVTANFPDVSDKAIEVFETAVDIADAERRSGLRCDEKCAVVRDDAMAPTIREGDTIWYRTDAPVADGCLIYVMLRDKPTLRRFYRAGAGYKLVADNKDYPPTSFRMMPDIIGVVVRRRIPIKRIMDEEVSRYDERERTEHNH